MIEVTRLNGSTLHLNPHQIEFIECTPDTTVALLSGRRMVVREDYQTVYDRIVSYRRLIGAFKNEE